MYICRLVRGTMKINKVCDGRDPRITIFFHSRSHLKFKHTLDADLTIEGGVLNSLVYTVMPVNRNIPSTYYDATTPWEPRCKQRFLRRCQRWSTSAIQFRSTMSDIETTFILPNELIALVFNELDALSLLKCREVCTLLSLSASCHQPTHSESRYADCSILSLPIMRNFNTKSICSLHGLRTEATVILIRLVAFAPSDNINRLGTTCYFRILGS